ncbi:hypothetical protein AVEN_27562-1 [Araneus ventricosus]|uniref:Uncharacterized protein n=1 Tax=Araneus ventricosus TaxID=182803 RepID=A0A4Y2EGB9_ARAVE|nr:hypothetical protein AVEN_27562-1 [Araneus ventricosus]
MSSEPDGLVEEKEVTVLVLTYLSGLSLAGPLDCTDVGESAMVEATLEEGINVTFSWMAEEFEDRSYIVGMGLSLLVLSKNQLLRSVAVADYILTEVGGLVD